jgi:hypothetical protein
MITIDQSVFSVNPIFISKRNPCLLIKSGKSLFPLKIHFHAPLCRRVGMNVSGINGQGHDKESMETTRDEEREQCLSA